MSQLLRGISVFVGSKEEPFLVDFVKSGSLSTVLDLLVLAEVSEDDKQDALELLSHIHIMVFFFLFFFFDLYSTYSSSREDLQGTHIRATGAPNDRRLHAKVYSSTHPLPMYFATTCSGHRQPFM
jgi:hypothetical protein